MVDFYIDRSSRSCNLGGITDIIQAFLLGPHDHSVTFQQDAIPLLHAGSLLVWDGGDRYTLDTLLARLVGAGLDTDVRGTGVAGDWGVLSWLADISVAWCVVCASAVGWRVLAS